MGESKEELEQEVERLQTEVERLKQASPTDTGKKPSSGQHQDGSGDDSVSLTRRNFLKAAGLGAAGIGTIGLASGLEIHSDYPFQYFNKTSNNALFEVNQQGDVSAEDVSAQTVSTTGVSVDLVVPSGTRLQIGANQHAEHVIPAGRSFDVDGELVVDGSFVFQGANT